MTLQTRYVLFTENKQDWPHTVSPLEQASFTIQCMEGLFLGWEFLVSGESSMLRMSWRGRSTKMQKNLFWMVPSFDFLCNKFPGSILTKIIILDRLWMHLDVVTPPVENTWQSFSNNSFDELVLFFTKLLRISLLESTVARSHQDTPEID